MPELLSRQRRRRRSACSATKFGHDTLAGTVSQAKNLGRCGYWQLLEERRLLMAAYIRDYWSL